MHLYRTPMGEQMEDKSQGELMLGWRILTQLINIMFNVNQCFSLENVSGKKCFTIGARGLVSIWADTPRYWIWHPAPDIKFPELAELISVCWLEIRGTIRASLLSPDTNYAAYFVFKIADAAYGFYSPAELGIKTDCGKIETQTVYLYPDGESHRYQIYPRQARVFKRIQATVARAQVAAQLDRTKQFPTQRRDGWLELETREFFISRDEVGDVEMSVMDVKNGNWKGGLMIEGIEIRPKMAMH